jgi:hypothetical protein
MERDACLESLLLRILQGPPKKESSLHVPIAPIEKVVTFPQLYFICRSKSPVNEPPPPVSPKGPLWREIPLSRASFYVSPGVPINKFS